MRTCWIGLKMIIQIVTAFVVALCVVGSEGSYFSSYYPYYRRSDALTPKQVRSLTEIYGLTPSRFGPFLQTNIWKSEETLPNGKPQANAFLLVLNKVCAPWNIFSKDRFFHWHDGRAIIDKIDSNGKRVSECLGSTAKFPYCKYVVKIPRDTYTTFRPANDLAILTGVVINGDLDDGRHISFDEIYNKFGDKHGALIKHSRKCYIGFSRHLADA